MNDSPRSVQPFQYSISDPIFDVVQVSRKLARKATLAILLFYGVVLSLFTTVTEFQVPNDVNFRHIESVIAHIVLLYLWALLRVGGFFIIGLIPTLVISEFSGWIIGKLFYSQIHDVLSPQRAHYLGIGVSAALLVMRLLLLAFFTRHSLNEFGSWVWWYGPNVLWFFGMWWVVYRVNERTAFPVSVLPLTSP